MKTMTVNELINALLEMKQPDAKVRVQGDVTREDTDLYKSVYEFRQEVVGVWSELNVVVLEVRE